MGSMCVSSCRFYSECGVCVICSLFMFLSDASGDHMVGTY